MIACDVNVLISAYNIEDPRQGEFQAWLERTLVGGEAVGLPSMVLSGFVRIMTNRRALRAPLTTEQALDLVDELVSAPRAVRLEPGLDHWSLFTDLCRRVGARANLVPDAYLAALAMEQGCVWISADRGFSRFPGLRYRHPLDG